MTRSLTWSSRLRTVDGHFVCLPLSNNETNCCHLLTKPFADGLINHSRLVQIYNLVSETFGPLFGLAHGAIVIGMEETVSQSR